MSSLDLWPIGNCQVSALVDRKGDFVWGCVPRVDGDPIFSSLLSGDDPSHGYWSIELVGCSSVEQAYERNTPILKTRKTGSPVVCQGMWGRRRPVPGAAGGRSWSRRRQGRGARHGGCPCSRRAAALLMTLLRRLARREAGPPAHH